jgi:hypothetical protein
MPSTHHATPCHVCGRPVLLTITAKGRRLYIDPTPNPAGNMACYTDGIGTLRSRHFSNERPTLEHTEWQAMPHPATCIHPQPRQPRRRTGIRPHRWQR